MTSSSFFLSELILETTPLILARIPLKFLGYISLTIDVNKALGSSYLIDGNVNISSLIKTILRVMQKYNLLSKVRRKKYRNYSTVVHNYPNLLNRDFNADRPNQKWATDISYISTKQGNCYLSIIRDLYDNSIVSYKLAMDMTVKLVLDTIRLAKQKEKVTTELQLHSDQGAQYVSHEYFMLTKSYGITPSMSRRGNPYDNAMAENFFSILKSECINRVKLQTYDDASIIISEYIHFYNNERIQQKTKLTPLEKRNQFVA